MLTYHAKPALTSPYHSRPTAMSSFMKRTIRGELITSTASQNAALMRNRYSLRRSNLSLDADSCCERQSDTNSSSDTYSDPDTEADTDIDIEPNYEKDQEVPRRTTTGVRPRDIQSVPPLAEEAFPGQEGELNAELLEKNQHVLYGSHTPHDGR
ncbi:hypothetical protein GGP41_007817 [Bipolaris sorokiniana]|uniref:Uncharacterized protein n=1 Tax=Cochliobolus sativus TaxID=45130 RepID=A0A8H5ZQE6_COCSA|nr:hypothetical protein GGP41_007817 [Bipolaris sorokiniana]